jgi:hypothetical protein
MTEKSGWLFLALALSLVSCEKGISLKPGNPEPSLVVEATIENGSRPMVYLTRSMDFFSNLTPEMLAGSFVRNAVVKMSNGQKTHTLKEYEVPVGDNYFIYYYSVDSSDLASSFEGEEGKSYYLEIKTGGNLYSSTTTIPILTKTVNTLYFENANDEDDTTKVVLYGRFQDPPGFGNYTRYFTKTNSEPFYPGLNSVYDDQIIDGKSYAVQIERGVNRNEPIDFEEYSFFHEGDTIEVKMCNIDKAVFDFWRTMEYSYSSIGNPFSSPTKVMGNISGGALGYFGGYAVQYSSIIIPE